MPIEDRNDAAEVEQRIARIFAAPPRERAAAVRAYPSPKSARPSSGRSSN